VKWFAFVLAASIFYVGAPVGAGTAEPEQSEPAPEPKEPTRPAPSPDLPDSVVGDGFRVGPTGDGVIEAGVGRSGGGGVLGPVSVSVSGGGLGCGHRWATYGEFPVVVPEGSGGVPDPGGQVSRDRVGGGVERGWVRVCGGGEGSNPFYWASADLDPSDLIPDALAGARAQLGVPVPDISPAVLVGGVVNLGMWLAVVDPGVVSVRASLADVWAQVDASVAGVSFGFGNGDSVVCGGLGTPIPGWALGEADQGPCGYTYRVSSPDDEPYRLTITVEYAVSYSTSSGAGGVLASIGRSVTVGYDVDEIQTIGISN
jgi:hypothetical protein